MTRVPLAAASLVLSFASAALADEYSATPVDGNFIKVPALATSTSTPEEAAAASTSLIGAKTDGLTVTAALPFKFPFFGTLYDTVSVADDGWLAFGTTLTVAGENAVLPARTAPNAIVAALWDDLRTTKKGSVVRFVDGTAPDRTFVVAWQHMDTVAASTSADLSFEVLLHEGTGVVEIAYATTGSGSGLSFTAGIENETGTRAFGGPSLENTNADAPVHGQRYVPNAVQITGTILRDQLGISAAGLGGTTTPDVPVAGVRVEVVREDTTARTVVATALTDDHGAFTATVLGLDGAPTLAVDALAEGDESRVTDANGKTWTRRIATGVVPVSTPADPTVPVGTIRFTEPPAAADANFVKALSVQQAANKGYRFALAAGASHAPATRSFPQLEIRWVPGSAAASAYLPATSSTKARATISDATANPDAYDDFVVLREYGQHVLASMAAIPTTAATHQWNAGVGSESVAFIDGYSFWFACAVQGSADFIDTLTSSTATVLHLETQLPAVVVTPPATAPSGALVPGAVAASLWDLVDDTVPAEPRDDLAGALPANGYEVLATLDQRKGAGALPSAAVAWTMSSFFDAWRAGGAVTDRRATSRILIHYGTFVDDASEPNDSASEATSIATSATRAGLVLSPFNSDWFSFQLGSDPLSVAVSFAEATEVTVSIADTSGAVLATASSGTTPSPVSVATPPALAPGPYFAVVAWKSGPAAHYTLGLARTITLLTSSLPEWTADHPFNQTLSVAGGLAPVSLSVRPSAPDGLTLVNPDGRLTGRPTTAGDFDLEVVASDASGAAPQTIGTLRLTVHPALTLPDVYGLPSSHAVDADVGTGGTIAAWTADPLAGAGLTLTDGPTLHLAGADSGSPRAFDLSASATDSVGAALASSTSHVVVCAPVARARGTSAAAGARFGFWFDAIEGTRASFDFAFGGAGTAPSLAAIVDDAGVKLDFASVVRRQGGRTRITNLVVPRTARYFVVFKAVDAASVTASRPSFRAPARFSGIADLDAGHDAAGDPVYTDLVRVDARADSTAVVVLRSGRAPDAPLPGDIAADRVEIGFVPHGAPAGTQPVYAAILSLGQHVTRQSADGGRRLTFRGVALAATGEYFVRVLGDNTTAGPLACEVQVSPANRAANFLP